jgi:hypothetical protein
VRRIVKCTVLSGPGPTPYDWIPLARNWELSVAPVDIEGRTLIPTAAAKALLRVADYTDKRNCFGKHIAVTHKLSETKPYINH